MRTKHVIGASRTASLLRACNWGGTPLGKIDGWSDSLLCSINLMFACRFPALIVWGPEMIQFYNDDFIPLVAEKHPVALGQPARDCWGEAWHIIGPQFEAALLRGEASFKENVLVPIVRNGTLQDVYWTYSYSPIFDADGDIGGILIVCQDKTSEMLDANRRHQAEAALLGEREALDELFHQAPAFIAVLSGPTHIFKLCNASYRRMVGNRDLVGKPILEAMPEVADQGYIALLDSVYRTGKTYVAHGARIALDRNADEALEDRYIDFVYQPKREVDGSVSGIIALGVDVTERKVAEQTLMQTEKLAAVGRLASSIAHEINNPLESVTNLLYLSRTSPDLPAGLDEYLDLAEQELRRVSTIANQTLSFYRPSDQATMTNCEDMFRSVLTIYQGRLNNSRIVVEKRKRDVVPILCFASEIRQVLSNIIGNAIDAMHLDGGRLLLRSRCATSWTTGQKGLMLSVADTGIGMRQQELTKIFSAFYTTKGNRGNGLGLWISQEIVERHQGALRVRSSQVDGRRGTVFTLFLPEKADVGSPMGILR